MKLVFVIPGGGSTWPWPLCEIVNLHEVDVCDIYNGYGANIIDKPFPTLGSTCTRSFHRCMGVMPSVSSPGGGPMWPLCEIVNLHEVGVCDIYNGYGTNIIDKPFPALGSTCTRSFHRCMGVMPSVSSPGGGPT